MIVAFFAAMFVHGIMDERRAWKRCGENDG